jgi:hypothetical protein
LRSARLQGLPEVGPARILATMLGALGISTLRSIKTMTQFFFSFLEHQTSHAVCFNAWDYSTSVSSTPSFFLVVPTCWEIRFSSRRYSIYYFFFFSSYLDHHTGHPARHDARILLMSASSMPSEFFIVVSIYWKPTFYRSSLDLSSFSKTLNRLIAKLICFFLFFWTDVHAIRPVDSSTTYETWVHLARGLMRHGYPWVPTDQAHGHPRQVGPAY